MEKDDENDPKKGEEKINSEDASDHLKNNDLEAILKSNKEILDTIQTILIVQNGNSGKIDDHFRRIGFFCAVDEFKEQPSNSLELRIKEHFENYRLNVESIDSLYELKERTLENKLEILEVDINEQKIIKEKYVDGLKDVNTSIIQIESELKGLRENLLQLLSEISNSKEGMIIKRFDELENELNKLIEINESIENKHNPKYKKEYDEDKEVDLNKIKFYENLKNDFSEHYNDLRKRIKILNNAGVNNFSSIILIAFGLISSLIGGWLFSIWTGPAPTFKDGSITKNSSVKFNLIDLLAKFTINFGWRELILGVIFYLIIIGVFSYISYKLLIHYKFVDSSEKKNREEDLSFDINEENNLLKGKFYSSTFFSLWLKISPIILFIFLTLAIVSKEAFQKGEDEFQKMFDSLTNQAMGNLMTFVFAGFAYLYIIKIIEPRYLVDSEKEDKETGSLLLSWEISLTGIIFLVMIVSMIISKVKPTYQNAFFEFFTIFGFLFFCLTTGFSIGFGFRFIGLDLTQNKLLNYLTICTNNIQRLSKPRRNYYTDNELFNNGVLHLQYQMFNLIVDRNTLAHKISSNLKENQNQQQFIAPPVLIVQEKHENSSTNYIDTSKESNNNTDTQNISFVEKIKNWISKVWQNLEKDEIENEKKESLRKKISKDDEAYFPEITMKIKEIHSQLDERTIQLKNLQKETEDYWTNSGIIKRNNDIIKSISSEIQDLKDEKFNIKELTRDKKNKLFEDYRIQIALLKEGYLTGQWFLKENGDLYLNSSK